VCRVAHSVSESQAPFSGVVLLSPIGHATMPVSAEHGRVPPWDRRPRRMQSDRATSRDILKGTGPRVAGYLNAADADRPASLSAPFGACAPFRKRPEIPCASRRAGHDGLTSSNVVLRRALWAPGHEVTRGLGLPQRAASGTAARIDGRNSSSASGRRVTPQEWRS
jgi:hypothetical protein